MHKQKNNKTKQGRHHALLQREVRAECSYYKALSRGKSCVRQQSELIGADDNILHHSGLVDTHFWSDFDTADQDQAILQSLTEHFTLAATPSVEDGHMILTLGNAEERIRMLWDIEPGEQDVKEAVSADFNVESLKDNVPSEIAFQLPDTAYLLARESLIRHYVPFPKLRSFLTDWNMHRNDCLFHVHIKQQPMGPRPLG